MANAEQESSKHRSSEPQHARSNRRFRLAEIFAEVNPSKYAATSAAENTESGEDESDGNFDSVDGSKQAQRRLDERASALGVKLPPVAGQDVIATANRVYDTTPRASVLRVEEKKASEPKNNTDEVAHESSSPTGFGSLLSRSRARRDAAHDPAVRERSVRNVMTRTVATHDEVLEGEDEIAGKSAGKFSPSRFLSGNFSPNTLAPNETLTWNEDTMASTPEAFNPNPRDNRGTAQHSVALRDAALRGQNTDMRATPMNIHPDNETALYSEIEQLRGGMEEMYRVMTEMQERGDAQDKVFNTLHAELQDYKNDFIYEHMKPVVRPLLFLFDHMEQFENELSSQRNPTPTANGERRLLSPELMCENISFFREQLVEALRICEVTPMKRPEGEVDSRLHKVVDTMPTDAAGHNIIQRVVRSGWYLNGRVFRPAEVIIGLTRQ